MFESMKLLDSDEIEDVENQYELVVKMTKELEWLLEQDFDGPKNSRMLGWLRRPKLRVRPMANRCRPS